jgi:hypothetical protein
MRRNGLARYTLNHGLGTALVVLPLTHNPHRKAGLALLTTSVENQSNPNR